MKPRSCALKLTLSICITAALSSAALAGESTTYAPDVIDRTGDESRISGPEPGRIGSLAGIGAKPSKAELAKMKAQAQGSSNAEGARQVAMTDSDRQFMAMAVSHSMHKVQLGQMAVQQGQSAEVKKLGRMLASEHTKCSDQLVAIAAKRGLKLDARPKAQKTARKDLPAFDQTWLGTAAGDHQRDIALYQRQAQQGADPELRKFAQQTLPTLKKHLGMLQIAQQKAQNTGATARSVSQPATGRSGAASVRR